MKPIKEFQIKNDIHDLKDTFVVPAGFVTTKDSSVIKLKANDQVFYISIDKNKMLLSNQSVYLNKDRDRVVFEFFELLCKKLK